MEMPLWTTEKKSIVVYTLRLMMNIIEREKKSSTYPERGLTKFQ